MRVPTTRTRREFLQGAAATLLAASLEPLAPRYAWATADATPDTIDGRTRTDMTIGRQALPFGGRQGDTISVNGSVPGPLVRLKEGERVTLRVRNDLDVDSSIHWHGLLVPSDMDGVPGLSFAGIRANTTFTYAYDVRQSGTYWYHSHSGLQEQSGHYGPLVIDPIDPDPFVYDRDYVVLLSDWTFEDPHRVLSNLKTMGGYYNYQRQTLVGLAQEVAAGNWREALSSRLAWAAMRMDPTDIADVTGATYTYLMNGLAPESNWTGIFRKGERIRLRFINGSAMSYFDVRIPGLPLTVVQADGQNLKPVTVDEFRIAVAETYDVIVTPGEDRAYTVFAESMDRSGHARGTLAPRAGMQAPVPERRPRPLRTMADMGVGHMGHTAAPEAAKPDPGSGHPPEHRMGGTGSTHDHAAMMGHARAEASPGNRLAEPGVGLGEDGRRVLVYRDLEGLTPFYDQREPDRVIELHLTGNMERYIWSFDGEKFSEVTEPIAFRHGERLRLTLVNDTMMEHPIHLHGMWMQLENGAATLPLKHTLNVKPAERLSALISADAPGNWAFHCHLLYHMEMGMFRVVSVS